ncbi:transcriptional regulator [Phyllobacterium salinisoli]|uniref:Transcriptional regulator n=1 Tax=Phyllobacterium salinisoli TaxID=1899321 RepID=A0A368JZ76_9HYPH|nr:helix-turn-helix domain-containing protein [Phyllobacterium salinisoli]RCS22204.1 transcriptional regulator [Phyllobacterium salinisoli]
MAKKLDEWHGCPMRYAAAMIGDRWKLLILRDLTLKGARRYRDFLDAGEGIATNILASRLVQLEDAGIVNREQDPKNAARTIYSLTPKGTDLIPTLLAMIAWSAQWDPETEVPASFERALRSDAEALAHEIRDKLPQFAGE